VVNRRAALEFDVESVGARSPFANPNLLSDRRIVESRAARAFAFKFEFKSYRANRRREPATRLSRLHRSVYILAFVPPAGRLASCAADRVRRGCLHPSVYTTPDHRFSCSPSARELIGVESFVFANW